MQLGLASLDRLVELVEQRGGVVSACDAAMHVLAVSSVPEHLALSLLAPLVDEDARLLRVGSTITLVATESSLLEDARFTVFDLETTGLALPHARICEIGAVRVRRLRPAGTFKALVGPVSEGGVRIDTALRRFSRFTGNGILVAHNARFDIAFVNHELARLGGSQLAGTVIDTLPLARNLLGGRVERKNLTALARFFGASVRPCHRALPDAQATAEVFVQLVELAQERGATTVPHLIELATPRSRGKRPARADRCSASARGLVQSVREPAESNKFVPATGGVQTTRTR